MIIQTNTLQLVQDQGWANKKVMVSLKFWCKHSDWLRNVDVLYYLTMNNSIQSQLEKTSEIADKILTNGLDNQTPKQTSIWKRWWKYIYGPLKWLTHSLGLNTQNFREKTNRCCFEYYKSAFWIIYLLVSSLYSFSSIYKVFNTSVKGMI